MNTPFPKTARDTSTTLHQAADESMGKASRAIESTRDYANNTLDTAQSKMRDLRGQIDPMVDMLASKAQHLARQSFDMAAEAKQRAQQSLHQATAATSRYVAEQPMRSVMIAAAVGAAVALLISASRNRRDGGY